MASSIALWVAGPSIRSRSSLPCTIGADVAVVPAPAWPTGGRAGDERAQPARSSAATGRRQLTAHAGAVRSGRRFDEDDVLDRMDALHFPRRLRRLGRLLIGVGEARELDHAAVGLDIERAGGARADVGG